jgi:hypothetical protein
MLTWDRPSLRQDGLGHFQHPPPPREQLALSRHGGLEAGDLSLAQWASVSQDASGRGSPCLPASASLPASLSLLLRSFRKWSSWL